MSDLPSDYFERPARRGRPRGRRGDPVRAPPPAGDAGDDRVRELRAAGDPRVPGLGAHEQVRRGLSRQALLRRLRARRRDRAARDRPREGAVRRRARERAAARRRAGQRCRLPRAAHAGRHDHGPRAAARRPPHARDEDQRLRPAVRHRAVRGRPRDEPDRHGRGRADRARAAPEDDPRRLVGVPAVPGLRALPRDRRRRRRAADGRHGALRRARRGRPASEPGADRRRGDDDRAQDARRRPRRRDPVQGGVRQEDQLGRVPGSAGRPARARDRRQGGGVQDRRARSCSASASGAPSRALRRWRANCSAPARA